jgi:hypothetical protein
MKRPNCITIRIFDSSLTFKNIQLKSCAVVNLTSEPEVFYHTAFKETNQYGRVPQGWFDNAVTVDAPRLRNAEACIEVAVAEIQRFDTERVEVTCEVKLIQASSVLPKAYCRALPATIEAIIHATRVKAFASQPDKKNREQTSKLLEHIKKCNDIVNRVAPTSRYSKIMADLYQKIELWRARGESLR